jgi:excisionase family DNA binding protein
MDHMPNIRTLTVDEISRLTNIPEHKVRGLIHSGFFPRVNIPGKILRVREIDVFASLSIVCESSESTTTTN